MADTPPTEAKLQRTKLILRAREHLEGAQTTADAVAALRPLVDAGITWGSALKARYLERLGQIRTRELRAAPAADSFGAVVRDARRARRMSLRHIARALQSSPSYVSDLERGNRRPPRLELVTAWAEALGVDGSELRRLAMRERSDGEYVALVEAENDRLRAALETIRAWDCLNPPRADLLVDLPWLRAVVDAALGSEQHAD